MWLGTLLFKIQYYNEQKVNSGENLNDIMNIRDLKIKLFLAKHSVCILVFAIQLPQAQTL